MKDVLTRFIVETPKEFMGDVAGLLNNLGAWLENMNTTDGIIKMYFRIPIENLSGFQAWLEKATNGHGKYYKYT